MVIYFICHKDVSSTQFIEPMGRLINLIHGKNGLTSIVDETGMYAAYSASLQSVSPEYAIV